MLTKIKKWITSNSDDSCTCHYTPKELYSMIRYGDWKFRWSKGNSDTPINLDTWYYDGYHTTLKIYRIMIYVYW